MHFKVWFLSLALFLTGSLAEMCYKCKEDIEGDVITPNSCAGGKFDKNSLPQSVEIVDCGQAGCEKSEMSSNMDNRKYSQYIRQCASSIFTQDKCFDQKKALDMTKLLGMLGSGSDVNYEFYTCVCHEDYCNGAGSLKALQAIIAGVAGLLLIARYSFYY